LGILIGCDTTPKSAVVAAALGGISRSPRYSRRDGGHWCYVVCQVQVKLFQLIGFASFEVPCFRRFPSAGAGAVALRWVACYPYMARLSQYTMVYSSEADGSAGSHLI
jgi:hypothetical protein